MSLLPYLMDVELRPRRHRLLDLLSEPDDLLTGILQRPILNRKNHRSLTNFVSDIGSTIKADKDKFQINVDVQHFAPDEISVKTADGFVVVEGKHEEKQDDHGFVSRTFKRRYALPEDCNPETVESRLSTDGVLSILAPKSSGVKGERAVPITQTGPVRRKQAEEEESKAEENGQAGEDKEVEEKSPQKKRRR